ncbi:hypothetical protein AVDCRST_MAG81-2564 [uncultured Synechococcales cyanobacterium]|uniref:Uncharacterized protein n=1 Tax=uncultured Synechococcales cyanobacterium TaxID=1936017 RepID=A0A6J4VIU6_9CYAN|nr:hypothetical protein AVDCRST_MAG81-2564 [uncultured Synechococcales cyanobacterium]
MGFASAPSCRQNSCFLVCAHFSIYSDFHWMHYSSSNGMSKPANDVLLSYCC